jgi:hypothetical protein
MRQLHVIQKKNDLQECEILEWKYQLERFRKNQMWCPMCEDWHADNTMCQANLNDFQGGN